VSVIAVLIFETQVNRQMHSMSTKTLFYFSKDYNNYRVIGSQTKLDKNKLTFDTDVRQHLAHWKIVMAK
jgi:hypothetical protein